MERNRGELGCSQRKLHIVLGRLLLAGLPFLLDHLMDLLHLELLVGQGGVPSTVLPGVAGALPYKQLATSIIMELLPTLSSGQPSIQQLWERKSHILTIKQ